MSKNFTILLAVLVLMASTLACYFGRGVPETAIPPVDILPQTEEPPVDIPPQTEEPPPAASEHISNARMAFDQEGDRPTETFGPTDDFFLVFDIRDGLQGEVLSTKWYAEENPGDGPTYMFYEQTFPLEEDVDFSDVYFNLYNTESDWPTGEYKVELFDDGVLVLTRYFSVR